MYLLLNNFRCSHMHTRMIFIQQHADGARGRGNVCSARKLHFIPPPPAVDDDDGDVDCCDLKSTEMCTRLQMLENAPATFVPDAHYARACALARSCTITCAIYLYYTRSAR